MGASMNTARFAHGMVAYKGKIKDKSQLHRSKTSVVCLFNNSGRLLVFGGYDPNGTELASVEMLSTDKSAWQTVPTPMFKADAEVASVSLP
jgi:hypothetical protein